MHAYKPGKKSVFYAGEEEDSYLTLLDLRSCAAIAAAAAASYDEDVTVGGKIIASCILGSKIVVVVMVVTVVVVNFLRNRCPHSFLTSPSTSRVTHSVFSPLLILLT
uniref:Potassium voltage-gated channel subfamily A member 1 n=1 Tax=Lygus hesperus TaxID=30085 RepID=A0A0A9W8R7_LYGHE